MGRLGRILLLLGASAALCASIRPLQRYSESYAGSVNVSGARLVGFMRGNSSGGFHVGDIAVDVPRGVAGTLCVTVTTRDARYFGEGAFVVDSVPGVQPLGLTSRWDETLGRYGRAEVASKAALKASCDAGGPATYIASGFKGPGDSATYVAAVNGGQLTIDISVVDARGAEMVTRRPCDRIGAGVKTAYDTNCRFELDTSQRGAARAIRIGITGLTGRRTVDTYPVLLRA